jgi:hypothetical protein
LALFRDDVDSSLKKWSGLDVGMWALKHRKAISTFILAACILTCIVPLLVDHGWLAGIEKKAQCFPSTPQSTNYRGVNFTEADFLDASLQLPSSQLVFQSGDAWFVGGAMSLCASSVCSVFFLWHLQRERLTKILWSVQKFAFVHFALQISYHHVLLGVLYRGCYSRVLDVGAEHSHALALEDLDVHHQPPNKDIIGWLSYGVGFVLIRLVIHRILTCRADVFSRFFGQKYGQLSTTLHIMLRYELPCVVGSAILLAVLMFYDVSFFLMASGVAFVMFATLDAIMCGIATYLFTSPLFTTLSKFSNSITSCR